MVVQPAATEEIKQHKTLAKLTRMEVNPAYGEQIRLLVSDYVSHVIPQENNIMAEAYYEKENPSILWLIERWDGIDGWNKSVKSSQTKALAQLAETALVKPAEIFSVKDLEPISKEQWRRVSNKADSQLTIMLFVDAKAGTQDIFKDVYHKAMPEFRSEPGVVNYQLSVFEEDDTKFVTYEKFRNNEAFLYHLDFPPVKPVIDYLNSSIKKQPFQDGLHTLIEFAPLIRQ
ncbi:MAG: antibiotic biosynthesis monooxygenase [Chitinophagaceae bacterium]